MGNIAKVKKIMCKSSMPLEMTVAEFVEQASDTNWECFDGLKGLLTKDEIIDYFKRDSRVTLDHLKELVKDLLERFDKPSEWIDDIEEFSDMIFLLRQGFVLKSGKFSEIADAMTIRLNNILTNKEID